MAVVHAVLTGASAVPSSCPKLKGSFTAVKPRARMRVTCVLKSAVVLLNPYTEGPSLSSRSLYHSLCAHPSQSQDLQATKHPSQ